MSARRIRIASVVALGAVAVAVAILLPPITRPPSYYDFADAREILGIPNFMDVASNAPWLIVGLIGVFVAARSPARGRTGLFPAFAERAQYVVMFAGVAGIALGSAYFHLAPSPSTLLWDRLPMSITFMALLAIVIGERIDRRAGRVLFVPLLVAGAASVLYWHYTESAGRGDERFYGVVQFYPMLAIPLIVALFPGSPARTRDLLVVIGWYGVAKACEFSDHQVFQATAGAISGHTLKHLSGGAATVWLVRMMCRVPAAAELAPSVRGPYN